MYTKPIQKLVSIAHNAEICSVSLCSSSSSSTLVGWMLFISSWYTRRPLRLLERCGGDRRTCVLSDQCIHSKLSALQQPECFSIPQLVSDRQMSCARLFYIYVTDWIDSNTRQTVNTHTHTHTGRYTDSFVYRVLSLQRYGMNKWRKTFEFAFLYCFSCMLKQWTQVVLSLRILPVLLIVTCRELYIYT